VLTGLVVGFVVAGGEGRGRDEQRNEEDGEEA
jgi:hypothetical protein